MLDEELAATKGAQLLPPGSKRLATDLTDNDTHKACPGVAKVCVRVLLGGGEGEVVTCIEFGGTVFLFNPY